MRLLLTTLMVFLPGMALLAAEAAAQSETVPSPWGKMVGGVSISARVEGQLVAGGALALRVSVRNESGRPLKTAGAFAWILVAQSRDKMFYGDKIPLTDGKTALPQTLEDGQTVEATIDAGGLGAFVMQAGLALKDGYPAAAGDTTPMEAGKIADLLIEGTFRGRVTVCFPNPGPKTLTVASNPLAQQVTPAPATTPAGELTDAGVIQLLVDFRKDAFAAKAAHERAVKAGKSVLGPLLESLKDRQAPSFARMWMATAVCEIGQATACDGLIFLLDDPDPGLRAVIAYYGPKLNSEKLDNAILARAEKGGDDTFAAWAARGQAKAGAKVSDKLLAAALASPEPTARSEIAAALAARGDDKSQKSLAGLLGDKEELVRVGAARAAGTVRKPSSLLVGALVASLDTPGDSSRQAACSALARHSGQAGEYNPDADDNSKQKTLADWKAWWNGAKTQWGGASSP